jgi:hypothetical protein
MAELVQEHNNKTWFATSLFCPILLTSHELGLHIATSSQRNRKFAGLSLKGLSCTHTFIPYRSCYCPVNHLTASRAEAWSNLNRNLMNGPSLVKSAREKSRSLKPVML